MDNQTIPQAASDGFTYPSPVVAWTTVGVLSLTYMFSFMDRQILVLLIDPIKADLQITDTQISLLTGFAFAVIYTFSGIPMGRAADTWVRKYVIIIGVTIWSVLTILCGFARSFTQLFLARMGVGFGEAALTPTAYAMVPDLFPPNRLARGMSVFVLGGLVGSGMSVLLGGLVIKLVSEIGSVSLPWFGEVRSWQLVLITVGCASLLMVVPLSLIPEPRRHSSAQKGIGNTTVQQPVGATHTLLPFKAVLHYLWIHKRFYGPFIVATSLIGLMGYGTATWFPSYFIRVHHWDAASTGITLGLLYILPTIIGSLSAGWVTDHFYKKGYRNIALGIYVATLLLAIPFLLLVIYAPHIEVKMASFSLTYLAMAAGGILFPTLIQMATPAPIRAQVSAIILMAVNLVGIGFGATAIALVTDIIFQNTLAVGHAIAVVSVPALGISAALLFYLIKPFEDQVLNSSHNNNRSLINKNGEGSPLNEVTVT